MQLSSCGLKPKGISCKADSLNEFESNALIQRDSISHKSEYCFRIRAIFVFELGKTLDPCQLMHRILTFSHDQNFLIDQHQIPLMKKQKQNPVGLGGPTHKPLE